MIKESFQMTNIFNFQEEEQCDCEACQITEGYLEMALECESVEELRAAIRNLYEDAHQEGYKNSLEDDIEIKTKVLTYTPGENEYLN